MPMIRKFSRPAPKSVLLTTLSTILSAALAALLGMSTCAAGQTPTAIGSITIAGAEGYSAGVWDAGTATATINGLSVQVPYGEYSTPASIAAGVAAKISSDCSLPVFAHAVGAVVSFYPKPGKTVASSSFASASNNPTVFPSPSFPITVGANGGIPPTPAIVSLSLTEGPVGMGFTITGTNFGAAQGSVLIGGTAAKIISWNTTTIVVQVPSGLTAGPLAYTVLVETPAWASDAGTATFQVDAPFGCAAQ
jgi:hypothetical protein